ncbi:Nitrogen assimilation transcription factor nit-4 [Colletotrichum tanaceti]|uniref:Nitrogen assimilation transcription factor nit-4 n=1 Tax=Colletotrichum tanaceti TaxID=1306861 RepID=A0A4U6X3R0_9PEZI|nr:Nitrogen assimilation transcription factor nit-4 [Colletotrichum tanaceti]TKW49553.1 Nitrogen assimilation transcription factor nit-4 [Colletotrichum tanaceti]
MCGRTRSSLVLEGHRDQRTEFVGVISLHFFVLVCRFKTPTLRYNLHTTHTKAHKHTYTHIQARSLQWPFLWRVATEKRPPYRRKGLTITNQNPAMTRDRHASRASFACVRCKKDKRRCDISQILGAGDGPEPSCTACRNKNEKCEVRYGEDKRSQRQPNETKVLQRRMQALEELVKTVAQADGKAPAAPSKGGIDADCVLEQARQARQARRHASDDFRRSGARAFPSPAGSSSPNARMTTISISPPEEERIWTWTSSHDEPTKASLRSASFSGQSRRPEVDDLTPPPSSLRSSSFSAPSRPDLDMVSDDFPAAAALDETASPSNSSNSSTSSTSNSSSSSSSNMHDFDQFLGSASLFPYYSESAGDAANERPGGVCSDSEKESSLRSRMALEIFPEPEPIVTHLLDLFWQWQSSSLLVVDRDLFLRHRRTWDEGDGRGDRDFYSPCLLYALLALASMISLDRGVARYSASPEGVAGEGFAKRARALLDLELDHPKITTVQAALVLGCRYGSMKDNSLGWMYSGIAFRMASRLGLHLDQTKAVASGQMTSQMAELRRRVFWGCHIEDNLFSAYCGRPNSFMEWDITVAVPDRPLEYLPQDNKCYKSDLSPALLHATSALSVLCSKVLVGIHRQRRRRSLAGGLGSKASQLHRALWKWRRDLPEALTWSCDGNVNGTTQPQVFVLHMHFYFALILLHRPFLRFPREPGNARNSGVEPSQSSATCATAAANITKLLSHYKRAYDIRQLPPSAVHFIFIAGSIHLANNLRSTELGGSHDALLLQSSLEALSEIGKSYPVAQMAARELGALNEKWRSSDAPETARPVGGRRGPDEDGDVRLEDDGKVDGSRALPHFLDANFSPLKELDGYFDSWNSQQTTVDFDCGFMGLGQAAGTGPALDPGMGWMSQADFGGLDGGTYPWLYH